MTVTTMLLAGLAGLLSSLSPCVLPLLPIVLAGAASAHRAGPVALAFGVAISFVAIGMFLATVGFAVGIEQGAFRVLAATILIGLGLVLIVPRAAVAFAGAAAPVGAWVDQRFGGTTGDGLAGQFTLGLLLGAVWSPCVGPTLGAASLLAAEGRNLPEVALVMTLFGLGAALPLLLLGLLSRETMLRLRTRLYGAGQTGKIVLGVSLVVIGLLIVTGLDKHLEAALVAASPQWLTDLTTRY